MKKKHVMERINAKTIIVEECWIFTGSLDNRGYGQIFVQVGDKPEKVHRLSAHFFLGYDFGSLQVNHKCDNKRCWNPKHIYIGTQGENIFDSIAKGTHANQYGLVGSGKRSQYKG